MRNTKNLFRVLVFVLTLFVFENSNAQMVYITTVADSSSINVYTTTVDSLADIFVKNVELAEDANSDGFWFLVTNSSDAQIKVFFTANENESDLKVFYVTDESLVGWKTNNKRYFFKSAQ